MKPVVAYPLVATAFLLFLTFSRTPSLQGGGRGGRRLAPRHAPFDPLVAELERRAEGSLSGDKHKTMKEAFSDEIELNISARLIYMFPLLDVAPQDNHISKEELGEWNAAQALDKLHHSTLIEMQARDSDKDKHITLQEFLSPLSEPEFDVNDTEHGKAGWWNEQFLNADMDNNGALNFTEFNDFLHPEDSKNQKIRQWLLREKFREMDKDDDDKLSLVEFRRRVYDMHIDHFEYANVDANDHHDLSPEEKFSELDTNKDGFLSQKEIEPIFNQLFPGELSYADDYTRFLMHQADDNKDGKLSLHEMLDHAYDFYSAVYEEEEEEANHDEL